MLTAALLLGGLAAAVLIGVALLEVMLRDSVFTAAVIVGMNLTTTFLGSWAPVPMIGRFTVVPKDVVFALVLAAGILRLLRLRELNPVHRVLVVLVALIAVSAVRGLPINGIEDTVRESRHFLYFFGGALYFSTIEPNRETLRRLGRIWIWAAVGFACIVAFRWAALVVGAPPVGIFTRSREAGGIRVIDAQNTLVVAQAIFLVVPMLVRSRATAAQRRLLYLIAPVTILLQHRTIWVVLLIAAVVVAIRNPAFGRRAVAGIVGAAAAITVVTAALSTGGEVDVLAQAPTSTSTIVWRFEGWTGLVTQAAGREEDYLIGRPFGSGYERELASTGAIVDTSPHNFYVQVYFRLGLIGLGLLPLLFVRPLRRLWPRRDPFDPVTEGLITLLITQLVFMIAWTPDFDQGIVTGTAAAVAYARYRARPDTASVPPPEQVPAGA